MKFRYFLLCTIFIVFAPFVFGQASTIKINEFQIEPTPQIVELLNTGAEIVDLSNWYIDDNGGTTYFSVPTGTQLYPNACLSFSGNFNLNRTSADTVRLFDATAPPTSSSANLIDSFDYKSSSGSGITFQRIPDGQLVWATGASSFDEYNLTGSSCKYESTPTATTSPTLTTTLTPTSMPISTNTPTLIPPDTQTPTATQNINLSLTPSPTQTLIPTPTISTIYLSEVYPYPDVNETEWVELYNDNSFSVYLDNWKIDDVANGGSTPKKFSLTIPGYSFKSIELSSSIFNNDGDDVRLLNSGDQLVDSFSYDGGEKGKSFGRISFTSSGYCLQNSSKDYSNKSCFLDPTSSTSPTPTASSSTPQTSSSSSSESTASVLGAYVGADFDVNNGELVRPTQYYTRPTIRVESEIENDDINQNNQKENGQEEHELKVVKSATLTSAFVSFLTAGFLFIRIIL